MKNLILLLTHRQRTAGGGVNGPGVSGSGVSGAGLRAGAATGCGAGAEILSRMFTRMSRSVACSLTMLSRISCSSACSLVNVARHLFLAGNELGGEMVDTLPHQGEIGRHRFELLPIRRRRVGRGLRRQPLKLRIRARYHLL